MAAAVVSNGHYAGTYTIENLSAGGALLLGAPRLAMGDRVTLLLHITGTRQCAFSLVGAVVRQELRAGQEHAFAVAFREVRSEVRDLIENIALSSRTPAQPGVLVVDTSRSVCHTLEGDLRSLGWWAASATTPLEALTQLDAPPLHIDTVVVDLRLGAIDGLDLLTFLAESHPALRRVLMSSEQRHWQLDCAIASGRAHALLDKPWSRESLLKACQSK